MNKEIQQSLVNEIIQIRCLLSDLHEELQTLNDECHLANVPKNLFEFSKTLLGYNADSLYDSPELDEKTKESLNSLVSNTNKYFFTPPLSGIYYV